MDYSVKSNPQVVILGVGNILMSDEGIGVRAVQELERMYNIPPDIEVIDGGTSGISLLNYIENKNTVYIIDAIQKKGKSPGDVIVVDLLKKRNFYRTKISPHQLGISDLLQILTISESLPQKINLIGIVPKYLDPGLDLSLEAKRGILKAIDVLVQSLEQTGIFLVEK